MLTDHLIGDLELFLKEKIREHYDRDYSFQHESYGDYVLQSARIAAFRMMSTSRDNIKVLLDDPFHAEIFFRLVDEEMSGLESHRTFDTSIYAREGENGTYEGESAIIDSLEETGIIVKPPEPFLDVGLGEIASLLTQERGRKYWAIRGLYERRVEELYGQLAEGRKRPNFRGFQSQNKRFFEWSLNRQIVVRYFTLSSVLPYYECRLEDLPLQSGLRTYIQRYGPHHLSRWIGSFSKRDFFLMGSPEMRDSQHWHPSRWRHPKSINDLDPQQAKAWREFRLDYLFTIRLGCRTKEDIIMALNDAESLEDAMMKEGLSDRKSWIMPQTHPYNLVKELPGRTYDIKPWELECAVPDGTWADERGNLHEDNIIQCLDWISQRADWLSMTVREMMDSNVPHLYAILDRFKRSSDELKAFYIIRKGSSVGGLIPMHVKELTNLRLDNLFSGLMGCKLKKM